MLVHIPAVLAAGDVAQCRKLLEAADWIDGRATAGYLSARAKDNRQLPEESPLARRLGGLVLDALDRNELFISAALPLKVVPPLFNRYAGGENYANHVDGGIRPVPGTPHRVRTDLAATLFLSEPDSYDGGELMVEDEFGARRVKFAAGDMVLYPGTSVHRVESVTRGERLAAFFWIQSMVRENSRRALLFAMDNALRRLGHDVPEHAAVTELMGVYHNLLRQWADT